MDDSTFDDLVKKKLKDYEDPSLDPSALESFHERLDQFQTENWYSRNIGKLALVSSLLLLTGINAYIFSKNYNLNQNQSIASEKFLSKENYRIDSLNSLVQQLQCKVEDQKLLNNAAPHQLTPQFKLHLVKFNEPTEASSVEVIYKLGLGEKENIPSELYAKLEEQGFIDTENGEVVLLLTKKSTPSKSTSFHTSLSDLLLQIPELGTLRLVAMSPEKTQKKNPPVVQHGEYSLQARNILEKHYFKGVGIQIAPHLDLTKGIFSKGSGEYTPRIGFNADWILSPRLSVETGLDYSTTEINFTGNNIPFNPLGPQLGALSSETLTNRMLSIPLSIKYRQWISDKSQLIVRAGYTPYGILSRQLQCNFVHKDYNNPDSDGDLITTVDKRDEYKFLGSTFTTSLGLMIKPEKNKGQWEASLFYERSLGQGFESNSMQLVGLRTAYWFKIK